MCLIAFFRIFSPVHGPLFNKRCLAASPSIRYSTLRKSISIKIVCGQTHPQNKRPNAAVNKTMKTINVTIVNPKMKKSCGQNILPNRINFPSGILNKKNGLPFIFIKGIVRNNAKKPQLTQVRILYNFPLGFWAYTHFLFPLSSTVAILSLKDSGVFVDEFISVFMIAFQFSISIHCYFFLCTNSISNGCGIFFLQYTLWCFWICRV